MATSLHDLSVPTFLQTVSAVAGFLGRAATHCAETGADPDDFVDARLFSDMAPFHLAAAMRLPADARAAVAAELIQSLDETDQPDAEVEAAWSDEIQRRLAEVDAGVVTPIPWPEARRRIFAGARSEQPCRSTISKS